MTEHSENLGQAQRPTSAAAQPSAGSDGWAMLVEHHTRTGIEWVVSFEGPNPPPDKAVQCANREEAEKLVRFMNERPNFLARTMEAGPIAGKGPDQFPLEPLVGPDTGEWDVPPATATKLGTGDNGITYWQSTQETKLRVNAIEFSLHAHILAPFTADEVLASATKYLAFLQGRPVEAPFSAPASVEQTEYPQGESVAE